MPSCASTSRLTSAAHLRIVLIQFLPSGAITTASLSVIGRFGVNIAYNSGAQYAAELIPTEVRGQGVAFVHVAGYAAAFFSPYVLYLVCPLPFTVQIYTGCFKKMYTHFELP
jgi:hypothetical protein